MKKHPVRNFLIVFGLLAALLVALLCWKLGWHPLVGWLVAANISAFALWALDKSQAKRGGWRVPEMTLHLMAALGASPASLLAMQQLRHKTRKPLFRPLYIAFLVIQIALIIWWYRF